MNFLKVIYKKILSEKVRIQSIMFVRKLQSYKYGGNNVTCNCCNKSFLKFLPYGDSKIKRENARCPWCSSLERTRMLWDFLVKSNILKNNIKVLHFAPESTIEKKLLKNKNINYISADINPNLAVNVVDITKIKYLDNEFDLIICSHVLSVVKHEKKAFDELYRVLKIGGLLILMEHIYTHLEDTIEDSTANSDQDRIKSYGQPYLERLYGNDFSKRISIAGFQVEEYIHQSFLSKLEIQKYGIQNSGTLFLCKKH